MRINRIIDNHHSILDDRGFIRKFVLLLGLIIAVSLFLIYHSFHEVDALETYHTVPKQEMLLSLAAVEKEINGNVISLDDIEGGFDNLVEQDLQALDALERKVAKASIASGSAKSVKSAKGAKAPSVAVAKSAPPKVKHKSPAAHIEITSVELSQKKPSGRSVRFLRKKFYATNNIKYAMEIAQHYYNVKQYQKALKWSLIANEVDEKKPETWILFAKTKMKMGKKQDALNVLNAYLKTYSSAKVSRYLKKLKAS